MQRSILVLETADAALAHLLIGSDVVFRELFLPEDYVETQSEDAEPHKGEGEEKDFHYWMNSVLMGS